MKHFTIRLNLVFATDDAEFGAPLLIAELVFVSICTKSFFASLCEAARDEGCR